jgi:hypothetical protein
MAPSRLVTAAVGLAVSIGLSAAAWIVFDTLTVFLLVPVVPFLF